MKNRQKLKRRETSPLVNGSVRSWCIMTLSAPLLSQSLILQPGWTEEAVDETKLLLTTPRCKRTRYMRMFWRVDDGNDMWKLSKWYKCRGSGLLGCCTLQTIIKEQGMWGVLVNGVGHFCWIINREACRGEIQWFKNQDITMLQWGRKKTQINESMWQQLSVEECPFWLGKGPSFELAANLSTGWQCSLDDAENCP